MKLKVLGSSSEGNCYLLVGKSEVLIIEAGVRLSEVKEALDYRVDNIVGCLVSHRHDDHAGYIREYTKEGITVLASGDVFESKQMVGNPRAVEVEPMRGYRVGGFRVLPFELKHDVPCLGYHIEHPKSGAILFVTDSYICPYIFPNLSHIIIECNYSDEILDQNIASGRISPAMRPRLLQSHMELETCKQTILSNDLSRVQNILLVHLSDGNSDERHFVETIERATGKRVYAADSGMELNFSREPF